MGSEPLCLELLDHVVVEQKQGLMSCGLLECRPLLGVQLPYDLKSTEMEGNLLAWVDKDLISELDPFPTITSLSRVLGHFRFPLARCGHRLFTKLPLRCPPDLTQRHIQWCYLALKLCFTAFSCACTRHLPQCTPAEFCFSWCSLFHPRTFGCQLHLSQQHLVKLLLLNRQVS